jgi:hypothetical protein
MRREAQPGRSVFSRVSNRITLDCDSVELPLEPALLGNKSVISPFETILETMHYT